MKMHRQSGELLILLITLGCSMSFAIWFGLLNNFAIERVDFNGAEMGILQSLREIPGFLAFTVVFVLLFIKEQKMAYVSLILLGLGVALTGFMPTNLALYATTILMSIGFHYLETLSNSLTLQWIDKDKTPEFYGKIISMRSIAAIVAYALIWIMFEILGLDYLWIYLLGGGVTLAIAIFCWKYFQTLEQPVEQTKKIILRKRYWLYYSLQFMSGARRQIFVVFAGFLMVEKFGYSVSEIAILYLINAFIKIPLAPKIGRMIGRIGERRALIIEYIGLIAVFVGYGLATHPMVAAGLYLLDHIFFAMAIALNTYFQKIANPKDFASSSGVTFTINHIAAVVVPVVFGVIWLYSYQLVFYAGAAMAFISLIMSLNVPNKPTEGNEVIIGKVFNKS